MKSRLYTLILCSGLCMTMFLSACKKEETPPAGNNNTGTPKDPVVVLEDTLCRNWEVKTATHNGTSDPSSVGLKMTINKNGTYLLHTTGYQGTWEFVENKTKVLLDKASSQYKTTWTVKSMTAKKLNVTFKSPFTGGAAEWWMVTY